MKVSTILDLFESCNELGELKVARQLLNAELDLVVKRSPVAMQSFDYAVCSWAFRYLCHSALNSGIGH